MKGMGKAATREVSFACLATLLSAILSYPLAARFEPPLFAARLLASAAYLGLGLGLSFLFCHIARSAGWVKSLVGALWMLATAAAVYSYVRGELVLLVFPALFCLPGAAFGAAAHQALASAPPRRPTRSTHNGFTFVEVLIVLGVIALLAALLLPIFSNVRAAGRRTVCLSNLKQLGLAVALYQADNNDHFPRGGDPADIRTDLWQQAAGGRFAQEAGALQPLTFVLHPYVKSNDVWHCPADIGFDVTESGKALNARPTSFEAFATSYYYRTELTLRRKRNLIAYEQAAPYTEHGPSDINMLFDGHGSWHGGWDAPDRRYNTLFADGHAKNLSRQGFMKAWRLTFERPESAPSLP